MKSGQKLQKNQYLINGSAELAMQGDGNLVLYYAGWVCWATHTNGKGATYAIMQADGNFVLYGPNGSVWAAGRQSKHAGWDLAMYATVSPNTASVGFLKPSGGALDQTGNLANANC